ncbi:MAG: hypothetical protein PQJ50_01325 [Spirochaetales bacterium]|nr:hypothetical protein [Spirochaetales bacterium]
MFIDSFYNLEFKFDKNSDGLDHLFPSMELLIRSLENIDRCLVSSVGYRLEYKRYLKNIGEESFTFSIRVRLIKPRQIALGEDFPTENILEWMKQGRDIFTSAANSKDSSEKSSFIGSSLNPLIRESGLENSILYKPLDGDELSNLSEDLNNAVQFLGGKVLIEETA